MKFGDTITSIGQPLFPGILAGYNGVDFDPLRDSPDNADGIVLLSGGQVGSVLRVLSETAGFNGTGWDRIRSAADNADALTPATLGILRVLAEQAQFNGATFDRARTNLDNILLQTLTAASANGNSADQLNVSGRGVKIATNVTAISGAAATLTVSIQVKDPVSGSYFTVLTGAGITTVSTQLLTLYPGIAVTANVSASDVLTRTWRVLFTITGTTPSVTATIGGMVIN